MGVDHGLIGCAVPWRARPESELRCDIYIVSDDVLEAKKLLTNSSTITNSRIAMDGHGIILKRELYTSRYREGDRAGKRAGARNASPNDNNNKAGAMRKEAS
jgi:hypothetical protein